MPAVRDKREGVESQRNEVHMSACRREIAQLGAWHGVLPIDAYDHAAPGAVAFRVARRVADGVLTRELIGNLTVDTRQFAHLCREKRSTAGLLRELAQHELRFLEPFVAGDACLVRPEPNRIDC